MNYFETNRKSDCNGCGVCSLRCPKKAIEMVEDEEGFLYPYVDKKKCINCGLCKKICSNNEQTTLNTSSYYAVKNKNLSERKESTSGGYFKVLVKYIINNNGIIFGAYLNDKLEVVHGFSDSIEDCKKFSLSKYVRSNLNDSYEKVEKFLDDGRFVMFSGTPCQCMGLRKYLKHSYDKLLIVEIICHSNPSPKVFDLYKKNIEHIEKKKIVNYNFRTKNDKKNVLFEDGTKKEYSIYNKVFNEMLINRPSCSKCMFCGFERYSDITIGDFWGIEKYSPDFDDKLGVSLVIVNTQIGKEIFNKLSSEIEYKVFSLEDSFRFNHYKNLNNHMLRENFFRGVIKKRINEKNIIKYFYLYHVFSVIDIYINKFKKKIYKKKGD